MLTLLLLSCFEKCQNWAPKLGYSNIAGLAIPGFQVDPTLTWVKVKVKVKGQGQRSKVNDICNIQPVEDETFHPNVTEIFGGGWALAQPPAPVAPPQNHPKKSQKRAIGLILCEIQLPTQRYQN